jgi:diguanylate cyclase (GGDEF)-like protein
MPEPADQPASEQPLRRIAGIRSAVWLLSCVTAYLSFWPASPWAFRLTALAFLYSAITAVVPYDRSNRPARLLDLIVDSVCAIFVTAVTGGPASPFVPLIFLALLETQRLVGSKAAVVAAFVAPVIILSVGTKLDTLRASGILLLASCLLVETYLLSKLGVAPAKRGTLLPERTVEDLEKLLEEVEEQNRKLRETHKELTLTARRAQGGTDDATVRYQLLAASLEENEIAQAYLSILEAVKEHFKADAGVIWAADYRAERLELKARSGPVSPSAGEEPIALRSNMQPSDVRLQCEDRLRKAIPSLPARPAPADKEAGGEKDGAEVIGAALRAGEKVIGAVVLACAEGGAFAEKDASRLATLSTGISLAIRSVEERSSLQRGIREISILHDMNLLVQNTSDLDQMYREMVKLVGKAVSLENCTLYRYIPDQKQLIAVATEGRQINLIEHVPFEHGSGISGYVAAQRKQLFIPDLTREPGLLNAELMPPRVRSFVSVPMAIRDHLIGVINVSHSQPNAFTHEEARLLSLLAGHAAMTIEREEMVRSLEQLAITDGLTGVFNHRYFQMRLENEVKRSVRYRLPFALLLIDLDHFKHVNDKFGHAAGDHVLSEVAGMIRRSVRESDMTARYGGEEFAVLLAQASPKEAQVTAERLRKNVEGLSIEVGESQRISVTISIGSATFPENGESRESLLEAADKALYAAKKGGRNRVESA